MIVKNFIMLCVLQSMFVAVAIGDDNLRQELLLKVEAINIGEKLNGTWTIKEEVEPLLDKEQVNKSIKDIDPSMSDEDKDIELQIIKAFGERSINEYRALINYSSSSDWFICRGNVWSEGGIGERKTLVAKEALFYEIDEAGLKFGIRDSVGYFLQGNRGVVELYQIAEMGLKEGKKATITVDDNGVYEFSSQSLNFKYSSQLKDIIFYQVLDDMGLKAEVYEKKGESILYQIYNNGKISLTGEWTKTAKPMERTPAITNTKYYGLYACSVQLKSVLHTELSFKDVSGLLIENEAKGKN